ncbi:hypothetical protein MLOOGBEN_18050 [Bacillus sp. EB106-08-02-XG196]|uniref:hypothetical protein n=1 Tax=Bacillus sp. EB106-08-02-XG196 TaxID=2737049 RepID=UPI0015C45858|nr:hypothetical protein [Bacillus sp. EB106-08-02-XG196]NWQ42607.1 hypothetical protein [Bacillus sp. EB106-08-02-XG196]
MKYKKAVSLLVYGISILAIIATTAGIFSKSGPGEYEHISIRGETVTIFGKGIYQDMSADVAIQGIAQDVVTLFIAIPFLLTALYFARKGSLKGRIMLSGSLLYFFLTYLFYLAMAMFNPLFLVYVLLLSASFFAMILTLFSLYFENLSKYFHPRLPVKFLGGFLIFNAVVIGSLWLQVVLPPLFKEVIPIDLDHYTTLIVQGFDLALFLPISFISGICLIKRAPIGYLLGPVYLVFLSLLMTTLTGKITGMALVGVNVIPAIFIIPLINITTILCSIIIFRNMNYKVNRDIEMNI